MVFAIGVPPSTFVVVTFLTEPHDLVPICVTSYNVVFASFWRRFAVWTVALR